MNNKNGKVYLIPCSLVENNIDTIPEYARAIAIQLKYFFVEQERAARRYLKLLDKNINIDSLTFCVMNEHTPPDISKAKTWLTAGQDIGLISEAGCPAIADPGSEVINEAHRIGAEVIPLIGPNSILLALMASGMNGQNFQFVGYLPVKPDERIKAICRLEQISKKKSQTQIFMETPYRNNTLVQDILQYCHPHTLLCVAADITAPHQFIKTLSVQEWKKNIPELHKRPAIFLLYCPH